MTNPLEPVTPPSNGRPGAAKASAPFCRYNDSVSRIVPRKRVSASVGAALGALTLACVAPSAIAAEPPPPPPPAVQQQGLDLRLGALLRITGFSPAVPGQTNLPLGIELNVPSVLSLKVETGLGITTPAGPGVNVGVQLPVNVDLNTQLGGAELGVNANVDASLLNGQDLIDAAAVVDVNAEADLLGLATELGANVGADVTLGKNSALSVAGDLRLPP
jgi:opacity protein-like surface antigen